jgi:predicted DNA-binding transcriptional regulator AlpA
MQQPDTRPDKLSPLMTLGEVCRFFGGSAPLHPATIYRGIGVRYPRPVKIGPNSNRWLRTECEAALRALADNRRSAPRSVIEPNAGPADVNALSGKHRRLTVRSQR